MMSTLSDKGFDIPVSFRNTDCQTNTFHLCGTPVHQLVECGGVGVKWVVERERQTERDGYGNGLSRLRGYGRSNGKERTPEVCEREDRD